MESGVGDDDGLIIRGVEGTVDALVKPGSWKDTLDGEREIVGRY